MSATQISSRAPSALRDRSDGSVAAASVVEAFAAVGKAMEANQTVDGVLHVLAEHACRMMGSHRCSVYLRDGAGERFRGRITYFPGSGPQDDERVQRLVCGGAADRFTREILQSRAPVLVRNAKTDARPIRAVMRAWDVRSMLGVPMIVGDKTVGLIFFDRFDSIDRLDEHRDIAALAIGQMAGVSVSQVLATAQLRSDLATAGRHNRFFRQENAIKKRLTGLLLDGAGLGDVCRHVSELSGKPSAIYDLQLRRLASASPDVEGRTSNVIDAAMGHGSVEEALRALEPNRPSTIGPMPIAGVHRRLLAVQLVARGHAVGYLVVAETANRLGPLDGTICSSAAVIAGLTLAGGDGPAEPTAHARKGLVRALLAGTAGEPFIMRRAEALQLNVSARHVMSVVGARTDEDEDELSALPIEEPEWVRQWATRIGGTCVVMIHEVPSHLNARAATSAAAAATAALLEPLGIEQRMINVLTRPLPDLADFAPAFIDAQRMLTCARRLAATDDAPRVLSPYDLGASRLFLTSLEPEEADRFAEETLGDLLSGGHEELLRTLRAYFSCGRSIRATATRLDVHGNTVRYRLSRVEQLTALDAAFDADDQLSIQVALQALWLRGRLPKIDLDGRPVPAGIAAGAPDDD